MRLLVVCTANQCRSPMAAAMLARRLAGAGVDAQVGSVGVSADGVSPATADAIAVMAQRGLDISAHRSRVLEPRHVLTADLIVGMTREHVREAVVLDPSAWARSFTLKELVRRAHQRPRHDTALESWLETLASERDVDDILGTSETDDVADPIGLDRHAYEETADELDRLSAALVALAWPTR